MRSLFGCLAWMIVFCSCDEQRIYEKNTDFNQRFWPVDEQPEFEFEITDSLDTYNLFCNVRNSLEFPYANIYLTYYLKDSSGVLLEKDLIRQSLFDEKTGAPMGDSGLGDIYDHQIPLKTNYRFPYRGTYKVAFEHYMRTDTLTGVLAVGLRVEKPAPE